MDSITHSHRRHRDDVRSKLQHADAAHATAHALRTWRSRTSSTPAAALEPYTAPAASPAGFVRRNSWSLDDALSWVDDPLRRSTLVFGSNDERLHELYEALRQQQENRQPLPSQLSPAVLNALTSEAAARHFEPRRRAPERHAPRTPPRPLQIHAGWRAPQSHHAKAASSPGFLADPDAGDTSDSDVDSDAFSAATTAPPVTAATVFDGWQQVAAAAADRRAIRVLRDGLRRWRRALAALAAATALAATSDGARARRALQQWRAAASAVLLRRLPARRHAVVRRRLVLWRAAVARRDRLRSLVRRFLRPKLGRAMRQWRGAVAAPLHLLNARARRRLAWAVARWVPEAAARRRRRDIAGRAVRRLRHAEAWRAFATLKAAHGRRRAALALATRALRAWVGRRRMRALSAWKAAVAERGRLRARAAEAAAAFGGGRVRAALLGWCDVTRGMTARRASLGRSLARWQKVAVGRAMSSWRALGARWRRARRFGAAVARRAEARAWRRWVEATAEGARRRRLMMRCVRREAVAAIATWAAHAVARARHRRFVSRVINRHVAAALQRWSHAATEQCLVNAVFARAAQQPKVFALLAWRRSATAAAAAAQRKRGAAAALRQRGLVAAMNTWVDAAGALRRRRRLLRGAVSPELRAMRHALYRWIEVKDERMLMRRGATALRHRGYIGAMNAWATAAAERRAAAELMGRAAAALALRGQRAALNGWLEAAELWRAARAVVARVRHSAAARALRTWSAWAVAARAALRTLKAAAGYALHRREARAWRAWAAEAAAAAGRRDALRSATGRLRHPRESRAFRQWRAAAAARAAAMRHLGRAGMYFRSEKLPAALRKWAAAAEARWLAQNAGEAAVARMRAGNKVAFFVWRQNAMERWLALAEARRAAAHLCAASTARAFNSLRAHAADRRRLATRAAGKMLYRGRRPLAAWRLYIDERERDRALRAMALLSLYQHGASLALRTWRSAALEAAAWIRVAAAGASLRRLYDMRRGLRAIRGASRRPRAELTRAARRYIAAAHPRARAFTRWSIASRVAVKASAARLRGFGDAFAVWRAAAADGRALRAAAKEVLARTCATSLHGAWMRLLALGDARARALAAARRGGGAGRSLLLSRALVAFGVHAIARRAFRVGAARSDLALQRGAVARWRAAGTLARCAAALAGKSGRRRAGGLWRRWAAACRAAKRTVKLFSAAGMRWRRAEIGRAARAWRAAAALHRRVKAAFERHLALDAKRAATFWREQARTLKRRMRNVGEGALSRRRRRLAAAVAAWRGEAGRRQRAAHLRRWCARHSTAVARTTALRDWRRRCRRRRGPAVIVRLGARTSFGVWAARARVRSVGRRLAALGRALYVRRAAAAVLAGVRDAHARRLRAARCLSHWMLRAVAAAWRVLAAAGATRRRARGAAARLRSRGLSKALGSWMDERLIRLYALGCLNAAAVALRRRGEGRAWRQWLGYVAERARSRQLLFVAVASAWRQTLFALLGWRGVALSRRVARAEERRRGEAALAHAASRWRRPAFMAMEIWRKEVLRVSPRWAPARRLAAAVRAAAVARAFDAMHWVAGSRRRRRPGLKELAIRRLRRQALARAWSTWAEAAEHFATEQFAVRRWANGALCAAFEAIAAAAVAGHRRAQRALRLAGIVSPESRALRRAVNKWRALVACLPLLRRAIAALRLREQRRAVSGWAEAAAEVGRRRRIMTGVVSPKARAKRRALNSWRELGAQRALMRRAAASLRHRGLRAGLNAWAAATAAQIALRRRTAAFDPRRRRLLAAFRIWAPQAAEWRRVRSLCARIVHRHAARALRSWRDVMARVAAARAFFGRLLRRHSVAALGTWAAYAAERGAALKLMRRALGGVRGKALRRWREAVAERRAVAAVFARATQQAKVFAFVKWRGTAAAAAARRRLLHRAAAALQKRGMRTAFNTWMAAAEERAAAARLINLALAVFVCRSERAAMNTWVDAAGALRRRRRLLRGAVSPELRAMRRALYRWIEVKDERMLMRRGATALRHRGLRLAWNAWVAAAAERAAAVWLMGWAAAALTQQGLRQAVNKWKAVAAAVAAAKQFEVEAIRLGRFLPGGFRKRRALNTWRDEWLRTLKARMVVIRARRAGEARALRTWAAVAAAARAVLTTIGRAVGYALRMREARGWRSWLEFRVERRTKRFLVSVAVTRWRRNDEARALGTWRATCVEMNERLLLVRRAVARIARRRELAAFGQWLRRVRQRYQLANLAAPAVASLVRRLELGALRRWRWLGAASAAELSLHRRARLRMTHLYLARGFVALFAAAAEQRSLLVRSVHLLAYEMLCALQRLRMRCAQRARARALGKAVVWFHRRSSALRALNALRAHATARRAAVQRTAHATFIGEAEAWRTWGAFVVGRLAAQLAARRALVHLFYTREVWAFRRFRSNAAQRRLLRAHGARVAGGHAIGELARALALWRRRGVGGDDKETLAVRAVRCWRASQLGRGLRGWAAVARAARRARLLGRASAHRWVALGLSRALVSWKEATAAAVAALWSLHRSAAAWKHNAVFAALVMLRRNAMRRNAALGGARRVAAHLSSRGVGRLLLRWVAAVRGRHRRHQLLLRAVGALRHRGVHRAYKSWIANAAARLLRVGLLTAALSVWSNRDIARALRRWKGALATARRLTAIVERLRQRGPSRALNRWREAAGIVAAPRGPPLADLHPHLAQLQRATNTWAELAMRRQYAALALADAAHFFAVVAASSAIKRWAQRTAWSRGGAVAVGRLLIAMRRWRRRHEGATSPVPPFSPTSCDASWRRALVQRREAFAVWAAWRTSLAAVGALASRGSAVWRRAEGGRALRRWRGVAAAARGERRLARRTAARALGAAIRCLRRSVLQRASAAAVRVAVDSLHQLHCKRRALRRLRAYAAVRVTLLLCGRRANVVAARRSLRAWAAQTTVPRGGRRRLHGKSGWAAGRRRALLAALRTWDARAAQRRAAGAWRQGRVATALTAWRAATEASSRRRAASMGAYLRFGGGVRHVAIAWRRWAAYALVEVPLAAAAAILQRERAAARALYGALRRWRVRVAAAYEQYSARRAVRLVGAMARFAENAARQARRRERRRRRTLAVALGRWVGGLLQRVRLHRVGAELLGRGARHVVRRMLGRWARRARSGRWVEGVGAASLGEAKKVAAAFWRWVGASNEGQLRRAQMRVVYGTFGGAVRAAWERWWRETRTAAAARAAGWRHYWRLQARSLGRWRVESLRRVAAIEAATAVARRRLGVGWRQWLLVRFGGGVAAALARRAAARWRADALMGGWIAVLRASVAAVAARRRRACVRSLRARRARKRCAAAVARWRRRCVGAPPRSVADATGCQAAVRKWRKATRRALLGAAAASVAVTHHRLHAFRFALGLWVVAARDSALGHVGAEHHRLRALALAMLGLEAFARARARALGRPSALGVLGGADDDYDEDGLSALASPTEGPPRSLGYSPFRPVSASSAVEYPVLPAPHQNPRPASRSGSAPGERPAWK